MAVRGKIGVEELRPEILNDPEILRVSRATSIEESEHYNKISIKKRWADVTLYLTDGRVIQSDAYSPRGDPDDPLSDQEISDKYHLLADGVVGKDRADSIERLVEDIDNPDFDLPALLDLIYPAP